MDKKHISGEDILLAVGDINEKLLEYPSRSRYRAKRIGSLSVAAMLVLAVSAVIIFYAEVVFKGAHAGDPSFDFDSIVSGGNKGDAESSDGSMGADDGAEGDSDARETCITLNPDGSLASPGISIIEKLPSGAIEIEVILSGDISDSEIPSAKAYLGSDVIEFNPTRRGGSVFFTVDVFDCETVLSYLGFEEDVRIKLTDNGSYVSFEIVDPE